MSDHQEWQATYQWYKDRLASEVQSLSSTQYRFAFSLACNERALPNYAAFQRQARWGNFKLLVDIVQTLWTCLAQHPLPQAKARRLIRVLADAKPSMEQFCENAFVPDASSAQDCVNGIMYSLEYMSTKKCNMILNAALCNINSINQYLCSTSQKNSEYCTVSSEESDYMKDWLHPLMQNEIEIQFSDLQFLALNDGSDKVITKFFDLVQKRTKSTLGFEVENEDIVANFETDHSRISPTGSGETWVRKI